MQDHPSYVSAVMIPTLVFSVAWFAIGVVLFGFLHWLFKAQKQPFWRSDMKTDLVYWFLAPLLYGYVTLVVRTTAMDHPDIVRMAALAAPLAGAPVLLQMAVILLVTDLLQYGAHRLFHQYPLWRFHSIHHAPTRVDWLTSVRMHPVNFILYSTLINFLVSLLGFNPNAFLFLVPFNVVAGLLAHANLNWTFGPFRYVIVSPVFHRWHHTFADQGGSANFAPNFPFIDLAFGTFHMPKGELPRVFGAPDDKVPGHLLGQLYHPFRRQQAPHKAADGINPIEAETPAASPNSLYSNSQAD